MAKKQSKQPRILVAEDNALFRELLDDILTTDKYKIEFAKDGLEALEKWHQSIQLDNCFDLILLDLIMPLMGGHVLLKKIRKMDTEIPVIVLTGTTNLKDAFSLLNDYQIADFISKPLENTERLLFAVKNALEKSNLNRKLKQMNLELEWRVERRTKELLAEKERAEFASQAKSNFLSHMSHELRTPMNAILGFAQILEMNLKANHAEQKPIVHEILQAGKHLLSLIDDTLDLAKIESGKMQISMEDISIKQVVQHSIAMIQPLAEAQNQQINDLICSNNHIVIADFIRLKQVFINLLSNAVKYNSNHGCITLDCKVVSNNRLKLSITDTGEGLSDEKIAKLFSPFERLDNDENIEGTGIGLVISKNLTELMGGKLGVDSRLGEGSTFWVELPLSEA